MTVPDTTASTATTAGTVPADTPTPAALPGVQLTTSQVVVNRLGRWWMFLVLVLIIAVFGLINHDVFTKAAWLATSQFAVEYLVLSIGETFLMITGEIDISNGAILGFSGLAGALIMTHLSSAHLGAAWTSVLGILAILAVGSAIGFINGFIRIRFNVPSFIVTLGMMLAIGFGAVDLLDGGQEVGNLPSPVATLGTKVILDGWLPLPVLVALVLGLIFGVLLQRTRFGLHTYMLGSSRLAARRAGVRVDRHILLCFIFSGLMGGVAGLLVTANIGVASPLAGQNDGLYAITAVVIGGASLYGGRGGVFGTFVGVAILAILTTGLVIVNVAAFWQEVAIGAVLIGAVCFDQVRARAAQEA
jgi:ribose transport system permease protein